MKNKTLLLLFTLSVATTVFCQDISRQQADSMINLLRTKKKGTARIDLLLNVAQFHVFKPGERQIDFDSASILIDEAASLNKSLRSPEANGYQILTESYLLNEKGQKDEAKKLTEKAVPILEATSNKHYLGRAYYELSRHNDIYDSKELHTRILLVEKAVNCFEQAGTLNQNVYSLQMLGDLYNFNREYEKAIPILNRALAAYIKAGYPKLQGIYVLLGQSNSNLKNFAQALFYMLKALKTAQAVGDTSMQMCQINLSVGVIYERIDNKEMSIKYLIDGLEVAKRHNDEEAIYFLTTEICFLYNRLGQPGNALRMLDLMPEAARRAEDPFRKTNTSLCYLDTYTAFRQFGKAQNYCDVALYYLDNNEAVKELQITGYSLASRYFISTKQFSKATYYLAKNMELYKNNPLGLSRIRDEQLWYKLDSAQGNYQSAFNHLHFYKTKMDSIFALNKVRQLQVLGVEYETAIKEDSIKVKNRDIHFLTQQNQLQAANLKQAGLIKNITIVGIILVLIILGLLYRQYRQKQKTNQVITQKNGLLQQIVGEKEWLLKEVHHRVKNNLQIIMSLLNSQSKYIDNNAALTAIGDSQRRVHAISLIHQRLYQDEHTSSINMPPYIDELVRYLKESFDCGSRIVFEQDIEPINLDVASAIPLGLIINEGIVNAIKYAFTAGHKGIVRISLKPDGADHLLLTIADNGIGLPANIETSNRDSLGFSLMEGLTRQLGGSFSMQSNIGLTIAIRFSTLHDHPIA